MKKIKMYEFLLLRNSNQSVRSIYIKEVLDVQVIDWDGEFGYAGENYLVTVKVSVPYNDTTLEGAMRDVERKCLVNAIEFNTWLREQETIKWLD